MPLLAPGDWVGVIWPESGGTSRARRSSRSIAPRTNNRHVGTQIQIRIRDGECWVPLMHAKDQVSSPSTARSDWPDAGYPQQPGNPRRRSELGFRNEVGCCLGAGLRPSRASEAPFTQWNDMSVSDPEIGPVAQARAGRSAVLDGEIVALMSGADRASGGSRSGCT
jgi:hypothetical protein